MRRATTTTRTDDIAFLEPALRRIAAAYDVSAADDLVQETLTRLLEVRDRLEARTLAAYAVVTIRNLISSLQREQALASRYQSRLLDLAAEDDPADIAVRHAEAAVVRDVMNSLPAEDRDVLVRRTVMEMPTDRLAVELGTTSGALATRMSRLRARARVDYALSWTRAETTTAHCRPVLLAIAAGDQHRQQTVGAAEHLITCTACADLAETVTSRHRPMAVMLPLSLIGRIGQSLRRHPRSSAGVAAVAAAAVLVAFFVWTDNPPQPSPAASAPAAAALSVDSAPVTDDWTQRLRRADGAIATGRDLEVGSVAGDELVLLRTGEDTVWIRLRGRQESPFDVRVGQRVSFVGTVRRHTASFVETIDVDEDAAARLRRAKVHIDVAFDDLKFGTDR